MMLKRLTEPFRRFFHTLHAGYYAPLTGDETVEVEDDGGGRGLPKKAAIGVAVGALGLGYAVATDVLLNIAEAASTAIVSYSAGLAGLLGLGVLGCVYMRCRKACRDIITETNMAGQAVRGTREDLYGLHQTQKKIIALTSEFENAAPLRVVEKEVRGLIKKAANLCAHVRVLGRNDRASKKESYEFERIIPVFANAAAPFHTGGAHRHRHRPLALTGA